MGMLASVVLIAVGVYLALLLLLFLMQSRLLHLPGVPGRSLDATPAAIGLNWEEVTLSAADGVKLHGWYLPAPQAEHRTVDRTVLFLHGNAGNISHRLESLEIFHELGLATLIIDYRGYGRSEGKPSEAGLYRDADAAWHYLVEDRKIPPQRVIVFGRSLGAAVAAHLAAERPLGGLILESAFTSVPDRGAELYSIFPIRLLARIHYPTAEWVTQVRAPVLVIHSEEDELIPFHHGEAVYQAAPEPKQFLQIQGDHNSGFILSRPVYMEGLAQWFESLSP
ncbi:alpha/beta hydrolase [Marinobacter sp. NP-4(2019)]|uniref:alpha/beta hydrolase n=1 Tax=Marinobacter sp. NP-4(2019) TaxID=2488665 RepID=UPI000FC3CF12|nr:alpha/beta hydrolase [Marinobacter sp. NP-4(2019)]AZT84811.1 alpha/beta hydrolase [Marinobacter sp. NP-4(2019)]